MPKGQNHHVSALQWKLLYRRVSNQRHSGSRWVNACVSTYVCPCPHMCCPCGRESARAARSTAEPARGQRPAAGRGSAEFRLPAGEATVESLSRASDASSTVQIKTHFELQPARPSPGSRQGRDASESIFVRRVESWFPPRPSGLESDPAGRGTGSGFTRPHPPAKPMQLRVFWPRAVLSVVQGVPRLPAQCSPQVIPRPTCCYCP